MRAFINIGGDLLVRSLAGIVPGDKVAQGILAFGILGPPLGVLLLNRRLHDWNVWMVALPFLAWTQTLLFGFVTFQMGIGLGLLLATLDTLLPEGGRRWLFRLLAAFAMLVVHPFALLFYAALAGGLILGPRLLDHVASRPALNHFLGQAVLLVVVSTLPLLVLSLTAQHLPGEDKHVDSAPVVWTEGFTRISALLSPLRNYDLRMDLLLTGLVTLVGLYALLRRRISVHQGMFTVAVVLGITSLFMPKAMAGTAALELRIPLMTLLAFAASLRMAMPTRRETVVVAALFALAGLARMADAARHWGRADADVAAMRRAVAALPPGQAVLPLRHDPAPEVVAAAPLGRYFVDHLGQYTQMAAYAVIWRQAFIPNLFSARGKQPLVVLPPYNEIAVPEGGPASVHVLDRPSYLVHESQSYALQWRERFDYALILNADLPDREGPLVLPPGVERVADEGFAQLLRLPRAASVPSAAAAP
jgi:hypothetical protein